VTAVDLTNLWRQRRRPIVVIAAVLVFVLVLEAGFYLGQHAAYRGMGAKAKNYREMQAELLSLQNILQARDTELAISATRHEVDRQALEMVRKEMAGQQEEIAGLVEGLDFYRSLMSPDGIPQGLSLRGIELVAGDQPRHYYYRILVQQEARKHELLEGTLTAVVTGVADGKPAEYSLAKLSEDARGENIPLRFRYFQAIKGGIVLPDGFDPGGVTVEIKTAAPQAYQIREDYPWQLEERFTHVGK
jgi:hypothetical protein